MLFIYLYHDDLYSDLWKSELYFTPAASFLYFFLHHTEIINLLRVIFSFLFAVFDLVMKHCLKLDIGVSITKNVVPALESPEN